MGYRRIDGEGLRTSYAFAPRFASSATRDGPTSVQLDFGSSPVYQDDQEIRVTKVRCERVVKYEWNAYEFHRLPGNPKDVEFRLIEITDSQLVEEIKSTGRYIGEPLHHLRISFDDHGTYDIVCERFSIAHIASTDIDTHP
jgi:hypothetical protein